MIAEGFLRMFLYREQNKFAKGQQCLPPNRDSIKHPFSNSTNQRDPPATGLTQEELDPGYAKELTVMPSGTLGVSIPWYSHVLPLEPDLSVYNCSFLKNYPDLHVADAGFFPCGIKAVPPNADAQTSDSEAPHETRKKVKQELRGVPSLSLDNQNYTGSETHMNIGLEVPGPGPEPMSNSLLNGLLEKQLDEVYLQHLTDNLARCNSHLGNSLLHGLMPPPQPSSQAKGGNPPEDSLTEGSKNTSYVCTQNALLCTSNFSSPMLRISEDNPRP